MNLVKEELATMDPAGRRRLLAAGLTLLGTTTASLVYLAVATSGEGADRDGLQRAVCWMLVVGGVLGMYLAGSGRRWAWLLLFGLQPIWIAYAVVTGQFGFVLGSLAYAVAQLNGYLRGAGG